MIKIENILKKYKTGDSFFYAINKISLTISDNEFIAITGRSGSGKSTLLNMIGTLEKIDEGNIFIDEKNIKMIPKSELELLRNKEIGFVFQNYYLEPEYSVYENIEMPLIISGSTGKKNKKIIFEILKKVNLLDKQKNKAKTLSGGEQQRVAIARALVNNPKYILADEPCGNLDSQNSLMIMDLFKKLNDEEKTIILVTHDENDAKRANRIIKLSDGKIISDEKNILDF